MRFSPGEAKHKKIGLYSEYIDLIFLKIRFHHKLGKEIILNQERNVTLAINHGKHLPGVHTDRIFRCSFTFLNYKFFVIVQALVRMSWKPQLI